MNIVTLIHSLWPRPGVKPSKQMIFLIIEYILFLANLKLFVYGNPLIGLGVLNNFRPKPDAMMSALLVTVLTLIARKLMGSILKVM